MEEKGEQTTWLLTTTVETPQVPKVFLPTLTISLNRETWPAVANGTLEESWAHVLKCTQDLFSSGIVRGQIWRQLSLKGEFITHRFQEEGACHTIQGHMGVPGSSGGRRSELTHGHKLLLRFSQERQGKAGK